MSENKRVTIPFLEKVLKPIVDLVHTKADKNNVYTKEDLAKVATSGSYSDLSNIPTLAAVAISGAYADLNGTPELAAVATSGRYTDLSDVPVPDATLSIEGAPADAKAVGDAIEAKIESLIDTAPEALDTLNELAAALGDDPNFATTVLTQLGNKADKDDIPAIDTTLTVAGATADAKAVGDAITEAIVAITSEEIEEICGTLEGGVEVPEGVVAFADQATGKTHSVYVSDGKLYMAEAE